MPSVTPTNDPQTAKHSHKPSKHGAKDQPGSSQSASHHHPHHYHGHHQEQQDHRANGRSRSTSDKPSLPSLNTHDVKRDTGSKPSSSSTSSSASSHPRAPSPGQTAETLKAVVGDHVRRSRCTPAFLEEIARVDPDDVYEALEKRFKVVSGSDAVALYKKFLGAKNVGNVVNRWLDRGSDSERDPSLHLVFAVVVNDSGKKFVDYYMTWPKGAPKVAKVKSQDRQADFLDSQFRRTARAIDKEFKNASIYGLAATILETPKDKRQSDVLKPAPPKIEIPPIDTKVEPALDLPSTPPSATASVMSLPFLNMIRNVPLGNRLPLRVTNPDRNSMLSTTSSIPDLLAQFHKSKTTSLETVKEEPSENQKPAAETSAHTQPRFAGVAVNPSTTSSSTLSSSGSKSFRKLSKEEVPEFLIAVLDSKIDTTNLNTWHGLERQPPRGSARNPATRSSPWDGPLAQAYGMVFRSPPQKSILHPHDEESSSSEDEDWENAPVIPLEPYLAVIGAVPSEPSLRRNPSVLSQASSQYMMSPVSAIGPLPAALPPPPPPSLVQASPYVAGSAQLSSPYGTGFLPLSAQSTPFIPPSRPMSHASFHVTSPYLKPY